MIDRKDKHNDEDLKKITELAKGINKEGLLIIESTLSALRLAGFMNSEQSSIPRA